MKLYVRILLVTGVIEYSSLFILLALGGLVHWSLYGLAGVWLMASNRFVKRHLVPPFFPRTQCHNTDCRSVVSLKARYKRGEEWTDGKARHVLQVFSPGQYEVGAFGCPECGTTIEVQKVTAKRLANWTIVDTDTSAASLPIDGDLMLGTTYHGKPTWIEKVLEGRKDQPLGTPVSTDSETLTQHMTIFGKTGCGKSTLLISIVKQMMEAGEGITIFDPDGDLAEDVLDFVPRKRLNDVIYFNIQDTTNPPPFNVLLETDENDRNMLPDELISIFEGLYRGAWGQNMTYLFRMGILAAMESGGSLKDVYDLLSSSELRYKIAAKLKDDKLREFWEEGITQRQHQPARYALMQKLQELVEHPYLKPIVGSRSCMFDADDVIQNKRILIVNLNTGTKPGKVLKIVGTMINNRMINAAYRQSRKKKEDRIPHFYCIDEFSNFTSKSFDWDQGLSKLRKYKLSFCFVTQYASALPDYIRDAIFGNVKILVAFCLGNKDAQALKDEFGCRTKNRLMRLDRGICRVCINGAYGTMRTVLHQKPLVSPKNAIKAQARGAVHQFREQERDRFVPKAQEEREIRMIENKAIKGELAICEFA